MTKKQILAKLAELNKCRERIAAERDKLRTLTGEFVELLDDCDAADDEFREGLRLLESAADTISQTV